jgi:hypothetical protein
LISELPRRVLLGNSELPAYGVLGRARALSGEV